MIVQCLLLLVLLAAPASAQVLRHGGEAPPPPSAAGTPVGSWSLAADRLGRGAANWRSMAVLHMAMHDALNAAAPRFARWAPPEPDEPPADGASPAVAMAAAAYQVLLARHQEAAAEEADPLFRAALAAEPPGPAVDAGIRLGAAIGLTVAARHPAPAAIPQPFPEGQGEGQWRPTPSFFVNGLGATPSRSCSRSPPRSEVRRRSAAPAPPPRPRRCGAWAVGDRPSARPISPRRRASGPTRARSATSSTSPPP